MKNDHTVIKRVRVSGAGSSVVNGDYVFVHRDVFLQLTLQHNYDWVNDGQTCSMGPLVWRRETDDESADDESAWICIKYDKSRWFIGLFLDEIEDYYMTEKIGDPFAPPFQGNNSCITKDVLSGTKITCQVICMCIFSTLQNLWQGRGFRVRIRLVFRTYPGMIMMVVRNQHHL